MLRLPPLEKSKLSVELSLDFLKHGIPCLDQSITHEPFFPQILRQTQVGLLIERFDKGVRHFLLNGDTADNTKTTNLLYLGWQPSFQSSTAEGSRPRCNPFLPTLGERPGTPWTGSQFSTRWDVETDRTQSPVNLTCMFWGAGRKPENQWTLPHFRLLKQCQISVHHYKENSELFTGDKVRQRRTVVTCHIHSSG